MNCPACGDVEMVYGETELRGTFMGWMTVGASYQKLFFRPKSEKKKWPVSLLASDERADAHHCPWCGGLFVQQPPWMPGFK